MQRSLATSSMCVQVTEVKHSKKKVFEKLVCEPFLSPAMLAFVVNCKALQDCATVCSSLAIAWSDLKYGNGKDKYLA